MLNNWTLVSNLPLLANDEVHLWQIDLASAAAHAGRCAALLSATERVGAARRTIGEVRDHFTIGRACLRVLIGSALETDPREVNLEKGIHGKPAIPAIGGCSLAFNLAHSKDTLLIALRRHGSLGVDVEYFDRTTDIMEVAQANFTTNESNSLAAIADPETRLRTFYRYWTRKEAIGKADGRGLLLPLASFDVSFPPTNVHSVRVNESQDNEGKLYFVSDLDIGDKAAGALALESSESPVRNLIFPLALLQKV
jgi:4'-phosphopantetheinyl transferase